MLARDHYQNLAKRLERAAAWLYQQAEMASTAPNVIDSGNFYATADTLTTMAEDARNAARLYAGRID